MGLFVREDDGATSVEYGLIAALVAVVIVLALSQVGGAVYNQLHDATSAIYNSGPEDRDASS